MPNQGARDPPLAERVTVVIELATAADGGQVVKRWEESFPGTLTSFLVSPALRADANDNGLSFHASSKEVPNSAFGFPESS